VFARNDDDDILLQIVINMVIIFYNLQWHGQQPGSFFALGIIIVIIYLPAKQDTVHKVETNILSARHTRLIEHLQ